MMFNDFLLWLTEPSFPPIVFFICLFVWYFAGFTSEAVCRRFDNIREKEKRNENNQ